MFTFQKPCFLFPQLVPSSQQENVEQFFCSLVLWMRRGFLFHISLSGPGQGVIQVWVQMWTQKAQSAPTEVCWEKRDCDSIYQILSGFGLPFVPTIPLHSVTISDV